MKKLSFIAIVLVLMTSLFMGCEQPIDDPEVVLQWSDVVPNGFWQVTGSFDAFEGNNKSVSNIDGEDIKNVFIVFNVDGSISLWYDNEPNGLLEPEDLVSYAGTWELVDGKLYAFDREMVPIVDTEDLWYGQIDFTDTIIGNELVEKGYTITGTRTYTFERRFPVYMDGSHIKSTNFEITFDDMDNLDVYKRKGIPIPMIDCEDWAEFTWGDVGIIFGNHVDTGGKIWINDVPTNLPGVFDKNDRHAVEIWVQPNDVAGLVITNKETGESYEYALEVEYDGLGAFENIGNNGCDLF